MQLCSLGILYVFLPSHRVGHPRTIACFWRRRLSTQIPDVHSKILRPCPTAAFTYPWTLTFWMKIWRKTTLKLLGTCYQAGPLLECQQWKLTLSQQCMTVSHWPTTMIGPRGGRQFAPVHSNKRKKTLFSTSLLNSYLKKRKLAISNWIFQDFNNWGINMQSTPCVMYYNSYPMGVWFSTISANINKIFSLFSYTFC